MAQPQTTSSAISSLLKQDLLLATSISRGAMAGYQWDDYLVRFELQGKLVGSRPVRTVVLTEGVNPMSCHVLFIDDSVPARVRQLAESNLHGVLTVSDLPNFARTGGNIGFFFADNQLRFQINLDTARRSGIGFSSKLLRLADVIGQQSSLPNRFAAALGPGVDWM